MYEGSNSNISHGRKSLSLYMCIFIDRPTAIPKSHCELILINNAMEHNGIFLDSLI